MLLAVANDESRAVLIGLLSGLTLSEVAQRNSGAMTIDHQRLQFSTDPKRSIPLSPALEQVINSAQNSAQENDLAAFITLAAFDSGVALPARIDAATVRHTYVAWLVRQGLRLSELSRLIGPSDPAQLASYAPLSPPGPGLPLEAIDPVYPSLR